MDFEEHIAAAVAAPLIVISFFELSNAPAFSILRHFRQQDLLSILVQFIALISVSLLADRLLDWVLEPPITPDHRGPFHWLGLLSLIVITFFIIDPLTLYSYIPLHFHESFIGLVIISFLAGYTEHFVLDYPLQTIVLVLIMFGIRSML